MSLYNNLADFGRIKMRVESVLLVVAALAMIGGGLYMLVTPGGPAEPRAHRRARSTALFSSAAVAVLVAWALVSVSARANKYSKLLAASSGTELFLAPLLL